MNKKTLNMFIIRKNRLTSGKSKIQHKTPQIIGELFSLRKGNVEIIIVSNIEIYINLSFNFKYNNKIHNAILSSLSCCIILQKKRQWYIYNCDWNSEAICGLLINRAIKHIEFIPLNYQILVPVLANRLHICTDTVIHVEQWAYTHGSLETNHCRIAFLVHGHEIGCVDMWHFESCLPFLLIQTYLLAHSLSTTN